MGALEVIEARVAIDEAVALLELGCVGAGGGGVGVTVGVLVLERSQLKGDLLTGGGGGCGAAAGGVGRGGSEAESSLGGSTGGTPLEAVVEFWELVVDDLENLFVMDSTIEVGDVDAIGEVSAVVGTASFDGGSSSISDTSSREEVEIRRWLRGDFGIPVSLTDPLMVVAGVIVVDIWLSRLSVGEFEVVGDSGASVLEDVVDD